MQWWAGKAAHKVCTGFSYICYRIKSSSAFHLNLNESPQLWVLWAPEESLSLEDACNEGNAFLLFLSLLESVPSKIKTHHLHILWSSTWILFERTDMLLPTTLGGGQEEEERAATFYHLKATLKYSQRAGSGLHVGWEERFLICSTPFLALL